MTPSGLGQEGRPKHLRPWSARVAVGRAVAELDRGLLAPLSSGIINTDFNSGTGARGKRKHQGLRVWPRLSPPPECSPLRVRDPRRGGSVPAGRSRQVAPRGSLGGARGRRSRRGAVAGGRARGGPALTPSRRCWPSCPMAAAEPAARKRRPKGHFAAGAGRAKRPRGAGRQLEAGMRGILITCNMNERKCVGEAYSLLGEYGDLLYGPEQVRAAQPAALGAGWRGGERHPEALAPAACVEEPCVWRVPRVWKSRVCGRSRVCAPRPRMPQVLGEPVRSPAAGPGRALCRGRIAGCELGSAARCSPTNGACVKFSDHEERLSGSDREEDEDDVEAALKKEVGQIRASTEQKLRRFQSVESGANNVVFIRTQGIGEASADAE